MLQRVLGRLVLATALLVAACFSPQVQRLSPAAVQVHEAVVDGWALIAPGGKLHPASFIEHKGHFVLEGCLLVVISYLLIQGSFKPRSKEAQPLSEKVRSIRQRLQVNTSVVESDEAGGRKCARRLPYCSRKWLGCLVLHLQYYWCIH